MWFVSTTRERPLRSSLSLPSRPVLITPMSALMTKIPPNVTASIPRRNPAEPVSPPIVPASRVRMRLAQSRSGRVIPSPVRPIIVMISEIAKMPIAETTNRPAISAIVPRAMKLSKA